jgi:thiamine monophosphate synthase
MCPKVSSTSRSHAEGDAAAFDDDIAPPERAFPYSNPPFLAIITESDSCDDDSRLEMTLEALRKAISTNQVDLISVRVAVPGSKLELMERKTRVEALVRQLVTWRNTSSDSRFKVVVSSDWIDTALQAGAHGVHFKETHRSRIHYYQRQVKPYVPLIGVSAHSVDSAVDAWDTFRPDYFFVGTCFMTGSHPEKVLVSDLEGPSLPGAVRAKLYLQIEKGVKRPPVLAIGGIDASNCNEPVEFGADGVAVIRAVLSVSDPALSVCSLKHCMTVIRL